MRQYLLKRLLATIPMFFLMTGVFFALQNYLPGGPVQEALAQIRGQNEGGRGDRTLSVDDIDRIRKELEKQYGLDKPVYVRYWNWVKAVAVLDFGDSTTTRRPAMETVASRIPVSLAFGIPGFLLTYLICIPLGVRKALKDGTPFDAVTSFLLFLNYSIPTLVISVILLLVFCTDRVLPVGAIFPLGGIRSDDFESLSAAGKVWDYVKHMFLPVLASLVGGFTVTTMLMKNSMLEVIRSDYIRTARAKGLTGRQVIFKHALRNAILPLMVGIGGFLSSFVAGSIVIESVFGVPGMGLQFLDALSSRDYNIMMAIVVIQSLAIMIGQIISDLAYVMVDPRIDFK
jgi:microcin C transport system permease protein